MAIWRADGDPCHRHDATLVGLLFSVGVVPVVGVSHWHTRARLGEAVSQVRKAGSRMTPQPGQASEREAVGALVARIEKVLSRRGWSGYSVPAIQTPHGPRPHSTGEQSPFFEPYEKETLFARWYATPSWGRA